MNDPQPTDERAGAQPNPPPTAKNGGPANGSTGQSSPNGEEYLVLQKELETTQAKLQEMTTITQRALADLQNYRRRSEEEKASFVQYANTDLILDLLPAIDNMNRARAHEPKDAEWQKGVEQTMKQLNQILEKRGVKIIEAIDQKFDPNLHEALLTGPGEKDVVLEELEKGYMLGDKVLKRTRVKVGDGQNQTAQ